MKLQIVENLVCAALLLMMVAIVRAAEKVEPAKYEATVESLRQAEIPEWFIDGKKLALAIIRKQKPLTVELSDYAYSLRENVAALGFKALPFGAASAVLPAKVSSGGATLSTGAVDLLVEGKVDRACGPTFDDGVDTGKVRFDLGENKSIAQVNTYASGATRARQSVTLYGSSGASDPGWNVADTAIFTPVTTIDSRGNWSQYEPI